MGLRSGAAERLHHRFRGAEAEILNWLDVLYRIAYRHVAGSDETDRSTPHDSPTATVTSNGYRPAWAAPRKTAPGRIPGAQNKNPGRRRGISNQ